MPELTRAGSIKPSDLPAPPQHALRIVRACANPRVTSAEIAKIVTSDPVLTAELLRIVNSAYFGFRGGINTAARAVTVLGQRALRNLVLCVSIRDALRAESIPGFDIRGYWEDALRRAVAARRLAEHRSLSAEEYFTGGLLQDFGMLVLFFLVPGHAPLWPELRALDPQRRRQREAELFESTHDRVGAMLAQSWSLPGELAAAMAHHHEIGDAQLSAEERSMCAVCECADWMAAVYAAADKRAAIERCRGLLADRFDIGREVCDELLASISPDVEGAAAALGLKVREQIRFDEVMREANVRLAEENLSYQELTWRLEKTLAERDRYAAELQQELELAREIQHSLLPKRIAQPRPIAGINIPARHVSGDFFDYFTLPDGRIYFNLADVSGKGMNAALLMAKTSSLFHCLGKAIREPGKLLAMVNAEICETSVRGMFVTIVAGIYNPGTGRIRLVNAGHQPPLYRNPAGGFTEMAAQAPPLGVLPDAEFPEVEFGLDGGSLYIFSDGVTEALGPDDQRIEARGVMNLINEFAARAPTERLQAIVGRIHQPDRSLHDDITMLVIEAQA